METLILPEPTVTGQALLFSPDIEGRVQAEEKSGVYTAERFRSQRPEAYKAVIQLLGADVGLQRIGKLLGIHHLTAAAVRDREPEAIDTVRSKMVTKLRTAVLLQVERLIEHPESVPMNVTGLIIAQLIDKAELLDGRATQRVERTERVDIHANWNETLEKLLDPARVVEIESTPAGIGLAGGNVLAIDAPGSAGLSSDLASVQDRCTDAESAVVGSDAEGTEAEHTTSATDQATETDPNQTQPRTDPDARNQDGGAGVSPAEGGAFAPIDSNERNFSGNAFPHSR